MPMTNIPRVAYHYCSLETFMKIIDGSKLRMTNIIKSNDISEVTFCIDKYIAAADEALDRARELITNRAFTAFSHSLDMSKLIEDSIRNKLHTYYVTCFSTEPDLLSQWRGYADNGNGVALGFKMNYFTEHCQKANYRLAPVVYTGPETMENVTTHMLERLLHPSKRTGRHTTIVDYENVVNTMIDLMIHNAVLYKNPAFVEEHEIRFVYYPFGYIRNLQLRNRKSETAENQLFYDWMNDKAQFSHQIGHLVRKPLSFFQRGSTIMSYFDIDFSAAKKEIIAEIVIGPKAEINDIDLRLFLITHGCDLSKIKITTSSATYR